MFVPNDRTSPAPCALAGSLSPERTESIRLAVLRADAELAAYWDAADASEGLKDATRPPPRCIFIDTATVDLEPFVGWVRGQSHLFAVPVVALLPQVDNAAFLNAYSRGADDVVVADDDRGIASRVQRLAEYDPLQRPAPSRGKVIVAHPDDVRRRLLGRILRVGGYDVNFARTATELGERPDARLIVAAASLPPTGALACIEKISGDADVPLPAIVLASAGELGELRTLSGAIDDVVVAPEFSPPDNLLFLANEILLKDARELRDSARVLHNTLAAFRPAGSMDRTYGLTYNLSRSGMYVRTLDPLARGNRAWIEIDAGGAVVHLRADVVWAQRMTNQRAAPSGFGIRFDAGATPKADLDAYHAFYDSLTK
jgi:CheY-like chemotaxis protein